MFGDIETVEIAWTAYPGGAIGTALRWAFGVVGREVSVDETAGQQGLNARVTDLLVQITDDDAETVLGGSVGQKVKCLKRMAGTKISIRGAKDGQIVAGCESSQGGLNAELA